MQCGHHFVSGALSVGLAATASALIDGGGATGDPRCFRQSAASQRQQRKRTESRPQHAVGDAQRHRFARAIERAIELVGRQQRIAQMSKREAERRAMNLPHNLRMSRQQLCSNKLVLTRTVYAGRAELSFALCPLACEKLP